MNTLRKNIHTALAITLFGGLFSTAAQVQGAGLDPFIGSIDFVGFNFAPRGWATCDGQILSIQQNTALFSLLGTTYGGDGISNFLLPDLRGRVPIHMGQGLGLSPYSLGQVGGTETHTLISSQMPIHTHSASTTVNPAGLKLRANSGQATTPDPTTNVLATTGRNNTYTVGTPNVDMMAGSVVGTATATTTIGQAGGSQPFSIMPPYLVLNCIIATTGIFPSRN